MKRIALAVLTAILAVGVADAQERSEAQEARVHVVRPGDTLWDLARRYLTDPFLWPEIFRANEGVVRDPHRIFPADRLRIPEVGAGGAPVGAGRQALAAGAEPAADRTLFFQDPAAVAGSTVRAVEEAALPAVVPGDFYRAGVLVPEREVVPVGRLAEPVAASVVPLQLPAQIGLYDRVFMTLGGASTVRVGDRLQLLRQGARVRPYGRIFQVTGLATVLSIDDAVATVEVDQLFDAVTVGDLAVPLPPFEVPAGAAPRAATGVQGRLVAFEGPHPLQAPHDIAFLDVGREAGVVEGDEFEVFLPRQRRDWGTRPEMRVARVQVVRAGERTSAVRVVALEQPALAPGLPVRLVGKMP